jgi:hypothetical protein
MLWYPVRENRRVGWFFRLLLLEERRADQPRAFSPYIARTAESVQSINGSPGKIIQTHRLRPNSFETL